MVGGLTDAKREDVVKPALLTVDAGIECFVLVTEDHGGEYLTVFIPAPRAPRVEKCRSHYQVDSHRKTAEMKGEF